MPVESIYPPLDIPNVGIFEFLFERKKRDFSDDKGTSNARSGLGQTIDRVFVLQSFSRTHTPRVPTLMLR